MTPGFNRAVEICIGARPTGSTLLDVPCGKGEAIVRLAAAVDVKVAGVDHSRSLLERARQKIAHLSLRERANLFLADGGRLPFRDNVFDVCLSIGGPSCIGGHSIQDALSEQARVIKNGGALVMSDMFRDPSYVNPWIEPDHPNEREWWELLEKCGLRVLSFEHFPVSAWDEYHQPIKELVDAARQQFAMDVEKMRWADEVEKI